MRSRRPTLLSLLLVLAALAFAFAYAVQAQGQEVTPTKEATGEASPERPTDLEASAEHDSVSLTWTASTDDTVTHYAVLRRDRNADASGVFHVIDSNAGPGLSYTDRSVSAEGSYVYRVKAVSPTGVSQWSSYARADTPAAPTPTPTPEPTPDPDPEDLAPSGLSVRVVSGDDGVVEGVALSWSAPAENGDAVTGYEILRAVGDGDLATLVADTGSTDATHTDATATAAGETYVYAVAALRDDEKSQLSGQAGVFIPSATETPSNDPPTAPQQTVDDTLTINLYADVDKPVDQLGAVKYQEDDGSVRIGLRAETNGPRPTEDFTATLNAEDQTALAGKEYEWPSQTFTFRAADFTLDEGRYVLTVSNYLRIINDEVVEMTKYFLLSIDETTLPSYVTAVKPVPTLAFLTVNIRDEDGVAVRFVDMLMIEGEESETRVVLDAQVEFPFVLVLKVIRNENYEPKEAFEPYSATIRFSPFETEKTFRLKSIDNDQHEPNQVFEVNLIRNTLPDSFSLIEDPAPTVTVVNNDPELEITDITKDSATARMTVQNADGPLENAYLQYGPLPFLNLRKGNWGDTVTVDIRGQDEVDLPLRDLEPATGYAVRVSLYPDFPKVNTRMREFTTRFGNLPEPPNSLSHTHKLTPYYQNGERKGFTLDWAAPILGGDDVVGYRIVRYYQNLEPGPLGIGPQPPVTLVENTRSQDTEYTDVGPLANGNYTYLVWGLDEVGPHPEFSRSNGTVTDAFNPPGKPVNVTAEAYPDRVELDWDEPEEGASPVAYVVERVVLGERGTGQVNHFETVRDDQPDNRTEYIDYIQRERGAWVNYYVYSADIRGFRSAPVKLTVRLGPDGSAHTPRLVSVNEALITWLPPAEYDAGRDAADKVREEEGHTGEQILSATVNTGLPNDPWVTRYRIEVNTWKWRKLRPHGPEGDLRIYDVDNDSWQEVAIVGEGGAEGYGPDSNEFRFRHFNIEDSDLLHHGDSILVRVSADNGFGWGPPSFLWELSGSALQTREDAYLDRGSVELLPLRRPSLDFTLELTLSGYYELEIARNMPPERYGIASIKIEIRSGGGGWENLVTLEDFFLEDQFEDEQDLAEELGIEVEDAYQRFWYLGQQREDCVTVDFRARVTNTKGEVSDWSKTLTASCDSQ